jgi:hypothetical protein
LQPEALNDRSDSASTGSASAAPRAVASATTDTTTPSVTREPRYAEIAASMNMGAAVYRFQTTVVPNRIPPGEVDPLRTVLQIRATPAVNKVT